MKRWKYRVEILPAMTLVKEKGKKDYVSEEAKQEVLNALGEDDWELVSVTSPCAGGDRHALAYLKKELT